MYIYIYIYIYIYADPLKMAIGMSNYRGICPLTLWKKMTSQWG